MIRDFWNTINNGQKVSVNILTDKQVNVLSDETSQIIMIEVPRADRHDKPVYIDPDPFKGTYRRNGEGDYHCTKDEIRNMFRDQSDDSMDKRIVESMEPDVLDYETVSRYRNRFRSDKPDHVWAELPDAEFLKVLGALAKDESGVLRPTVAGLLMFAPDYQITREFPHYFLDYQENDGSNERWTDRFISSSGDWSGNLYDFYYKVINRIAQDVKVPFKLDETATRIDDTSVHKALREVLANALINSSYYDRRGLVVKKWPNEITIANPGGFRIPLEDAIHGGLSDPRNETLLKMFNLIGVGERAGSGIPNLYQVWADEKWALPAYKEEFGPDRTTLKLHINAVSDGNSAENPSQNPSQNLSEKEKEVFNLILKNPEITTMKIAEELNKSRTAISDRIRGLKNKGKIKRIGSDKGGHWEVVDEQF
jgi:predicted HTH transcriptional regulator